MAELRRSQESLAGHLEQDREVRNTAVGGEETLWECEFGVAVVTCPIGNVAVGSPAAAA